MIKHSYEVTGVSANGENFIGKCVTYDIIDVIQLFRDKGFSVHTVQNRIQVHADSEIGIEYINPLLYPNNETMTLTETLVAQEIYKVFNKDDLKNFCIVRKQILKKQPINYFKNKDEI